MGYCNIRQQYTPELVRQRAAGSPGAFAALVGRGVQIGWEVGLFLAALYADSLSGQADDSALVKKRATELRDLLTRLGPTFIKAGQVRSPTCCPDASRCAAAHAPTVLRLRARYSRASHAAPIPS